MSFAVAYSFIVGMFLGLMIGENASLLQVFLIAIPMVLIGWVLNRHIEGATPPPESPR